MSAEVTRILNSVEQRKAAGADELLPWIYDELRRLAAAKMTRDTSHKKRSLVTKAGARLSYSVKSNPNNGYGKASGNFY